MKSYQEYRQILHGTDKYKSLDYYSYNVNIATVHIFSQYLLWKWVEARAFIRT